MNDLTIALLLILAFFIVVHFLIERQYAKEGKKPSNRWRRHLEKPPRLPFRRTRFDRVSGNSLESSGVEPVRRTLGRQLQLARGDNT